MKKEGNFTYTKVEVWTVEHLTALFAGDKAGAARDLVRYGREAAGNQQAMDSEAPEAAEVEVAA